MKLTTEDIQQRLVTQFGGSILFMPLQVSDADCARPVAQLTQHPRLLAALAAAPLLAAPQSLTRGPSSELHVKGLLHLHLDTALRGS